MKRLLLSALFVASFVVPGCASESASEPNYDEPMALKLSAKSVNVNRTFSDHVTVEENRLVVTTLGNEATLARIEVGSIVAGDRASDALPDDGAEEESLDAPAEALGPNPHGFLRRVAAIDIEGEHTILQTTPAELTEWIEEGDLDLADPHSMFDNESDETGLTTQAGGGRFGTVDNRKTKGRKEKAINVSAKLGPVTLSDAKFKLNAGFDGYVKVRTNFLHLPWGASLKSVLTLNPDLMMKVTIDASKAESASLRIPSEVYAREFIIPGPVPLTVQPTIYLDCTASVSAKASMSFILHAHAQTKLGFSSSVSVSHAFKFHNLSSGPDLTGNGSPIDVGVEAAASVECTANVEVVLKAFGAIRITGKVGPNIKFEAKTCGKNTLTLGEQHGIKGSFSAGIQVPFFSAYKYDYELLTADLTLGETTFWHRGKTCGGDDGESEDAPIVDSCHGRRDGFYCSELARDSGFYCRDEQIELGLQCPDEGTVCKGGTLEKIECD